MEPTLEDARFDVAVVGGGIAGASVAAEAAADARVLLLEREEQPGYHSTGRSASILTDVTKSAVVRALIAVSRPRLATPDPALPDDGAPLLTPRGALVVGDGTQQQAIDRVAALGASLRRLSADEAAARVPALDPTRTACALLEPTAMDIDVHALLSRSLRLLRRRGGQLHCGAEVLKLRAAADGWRLTTTRGACHARVVVDAAGAWGDVLARLAGARPIGLEPRRRTVFTFRCGLDASAWPFVIDADERFYFKPESGRLLASPADETPVPPHDARPQEEDVARGIDRIERATRLAVGAVERRWAGLRSFAPDALPVVGFAGEPRGFFWLVGQGGHGIQSSPALATLAAALIAGRTPPAELQPLVQALAPTRFG